jgi:hypothetical protein
MYSDWVIAVAAVALCNWLVDAPGCCRWLGPLFIAAILAPADNAIICCCFLLLLPALLIVPNTERVMTDEEWPAAAGAWAE